MARDAAIERLTGETLDAIMAVEPSTRGDAFVELYGLMDNYFTKRQELEMMADRRASLPSIDLGPFDPPRSFDCLDAARPDGF